MKKIYVLDTNVLLHDPNAIFSFEDNQIVIPLAVIEEVDGQKRRQDEVGRAARVIAHYLDELRTQGKLSEGVALKYGGNLRVQLKHQESQLLPEDLDPRKADNQVIALTLQLKAESNGTPVILVSKDINVRVKADALNLQAQDYETDKMVLKEEDLYDGMTTLTVTPDDIENCTKTNLYQPSNGQLYFNQFVHFKSVNGAKSSALGRFDAAAGQVVGLAAIQKGIWGIQPKNLGQRFAFDILLDERIPFVTMTGQAGTGKTLLALAAGLNQVLDQHRYRRLLVTRPVIPMGKDVGYLTGDPNQIDHPYLDFRSNGLCYAIEKFKNNPLAGHVTLTKGQRSELAELAAKLL